ncbi:sel1 repeat family protein [Sulfurifustis variabilis]|uniref:Sel1 repeat family protein n=1 Tax=Sulfurifustis variabilis TaxID=1675686 RepID=A0A1B4V757_9GAMM|nr:tetratricopeptide repeat protein [Sulfurifustis variabilis]BAU49295.1 sel1 repeat family protein [Sulfurifustis variabilis]
MNRAAIVLLVFLSNAAWGQDAKYSSADEALAAEDYPAAIEIMKKEARRGDLRAARQLAEFYRDGKGVARDPAKALDFFLRAAKPDIRRARFKKGLPEAQLEVAKMYRDGIGTAPDPTKAAKWYRLAAEQDQGEGQLALAEMYLQGKGLEQDYAAAYRWATMAHNNLVEDEAETAARIRDEAAEHLSEEELAELKKDAEEQAGPQAL